MDGRRHIALPEGDQGVPFPLLAGVGLSAVGGQGDDVAPQFLRQCPQRSTGVDGGQLAVVPHQDQLGPGRVHVASELVEGAAPDHGGLVDHDDVPGGEPTGFLQVGEDLGERRTGNAGASLQIGRCPSGHRRADDPQARRLPSHPGRGEHGRLAGAGLSDDQVVAVARGEEGPDPVGLLAVEVRVTS